MPQITDTEPRRLAQRFFDVVPPLMHGLKSSLHTTEGPAESMTFPQLRCLGLLAEGPRSLGELAQLHSVSAPSMSRLVNGLVERGWVERRGAPDDRRQVVLSLSPSGQALREAVLERGTECLAERLEGLTPAERRALAEALDGLARVAPERRERAEAARGGGA